MLREGEKVVARNKHPEETVNLILDVAFRLFMEKGYEHTSIQDIIDNLGGLSKGAIYHHFKSKEDILVAVTDRMTAESNQMLTIIRDRSDLSVKITEHILLILPLRVCLISGCETPSQLKVLSSHIQDKSNLIQIRNIWSSLISI